MEDLENDVISFLWEYKEANLEFNFNSAEIENWESKKKIYSENLLKFIEERVHPKSKDVLQELIDDYFGSTVEYFSCQNKLYYRQGFYDAISVLFKALIK